jgi:hypothetical protein
VISIESLSEQIRSVYHSDIHNAEAVIEAYIQDVFKGYPYEERVSHLERLAHFFREDSSCKRPSPLTESENFLLFLSMLFGKKISTDDLSSAELVEKLTLSFTTVFDTLNRIIRVIHSTLLGENAELETIRQIIGSHLKDEKRTDSLQNYLDQIQKAFLVAHQAFQKAAQSTMDEVLAKLDPDYISSTVEKGLKFGPLRKAELFEIYSEHFQTCKEWVRSGRYQEKLLKEFEKMCQKLYTTEGKGIL